MVGYRVASLMERPHFDGIAHADDFLLSVRNPRPSLGLQPGGAVGATKTLRGECPPGLRMPGRYPLGLPHVRRDGLHSFRERGNTGNPHRTRRSGTPRTRAPPRVGGAVSRPAWF